MSQQIVDAALLTSISHLEVVARQAVEGAYSGLHHSRFMGRNVEFSEYRPYNPGDELRLVDWRVYAKTDRFHVKQFEEDANLRALILLDLSGSMRFGQSPSKALYAQQLAAALSHLMLAQGDSVGVCVFDECVRDFVPPRKRSDQWSVLLETMTDVHPGKPSARIGDALNELRGRLKKRGLLIVISDLIDDPGTVLSELSVLAKMKQEILVFQTVSPEEIELPYTGTVEFHPIEGEEESLRTAPKRLRERYCEKVGAFLDAYRTGCLERGIDYTLTRTDYPLDQFLREYLQRRMRSCVGDTR